MELSEITHYIPIGIAFLAGANLAEYGKTKKWLNEHGNADSSWYERKIEKNGLLNKLDYYFLYPGRKLAYLKHLQEKNHK